MADEIHDFEFFDAESPVGEKMTEPQEWTQADRELVRKLSMRRELESLPSFSSLNSSLETSLISGSNDYYIGRQKFLRSYTFRKKETASQRAKKLWGKVKHKVLKPKNNKTEDYGSNNSNPLRRCLFISVAKAQISCVVELLTSSVICKGKQEKDFAISQA